MSRTERFLDLYKNLEEFLQIRYADFTAGRVVNPIMRFTNTSEGKRFKEELNLCREIRNILSHHARFEGEDVVEPSEKLISFLERLLHYLQNPPTAQYIATPTSDMLYTTCNQQVLDVLIQMEKRGFSHVPVLDDGRLFGVLSSAALFAYFKKNPDNVLGKQATVDKLRDFLPIHRHFSEEYRFVAADCSYDEMRDMFREGGPKKKRLAVLFVTQDGLPTSKLLGMITPWDLLRIKEEI